MYRAHGQYEHGSCTYHEAKRCGSQTSSQPAPIRFLPSCAHSTGPSRHFPLDPFAPSRISRSHPARKHTYYYRRCTRSSAHAERITEPRPGLVPKPASQTGAKTKLSIAGRLRIDAIGDSVEIAWTGCTLQSISSGATIVHPVVTGCDGTKWSS